MRSSGFGLGKKQSRGDDIRRSAPTSADLTQLLASSQKNPDKVFSISWQFADKPNCTYTLSVANCGSSQRDRRGWSSNAIDNSAIGEAEWKYFQETDSLRSDIFSMRSSDAFLVQTMLDESAAADSLQAKVTGMPAEVAASGSSNEGQSSYESGGREAQQPSSPPVQEGSLRKTKIRALLESFNQNQTTGRLICDVGTVQSEVFFTNGEPVHAKSCHSISQGRDLVGDASLIDLLTWNDGTYKFQDGWPAASKTITSPLHMFLAGQVTVPDPASAAPAPAAAPAAPMRTVQKTQQEIPVTSENRDFDYGQAPPPVGSLVQPTSFGSVNQLTAGSPDDFSRVDDLIGATYSSLVESSGLLKYGMFLMLVRSEFVRYEKGKQPFCFASIELELPPGAHLSDGALGKIGERFEKLCQPLDTLAYAGQSRFYALFPQAESITASTAIKQFMNNIMAIPLDSNLHGSAVKVTAGISDVPRDGTDFQRIFQHANGLRSQATQAKKLVTSSF
jgi:hypothetical protein